MDHNPNFEPMRFLAKGIDARKFQGFYKNSKQVALNQKFDLLWKIFLLKRKKN